MSDHISGPSEAWSEWMPRRRHVACALLAASLSALLPMGLLVLRDRDAQASLAGAAAAYDRALLDRVRAESTAHGWHEMYADRYPHAGGEDHTALYLESSEGFEVEVVVQP